MKQKMTLLIVAFYLFVVAVAVTVTPVMASEGQRYSEDLCVDPSKASASSYYLPWVPSRAFDNLNTHHTSDSWISNGSLPEWISYDFDIPRKIQKYTLTPAPRYINALPMDWEFQASNDGDVWSTLHKVSGFTEWPSDYTATDFYVDNNQSFRYYRLYMTVLNPLNNSTDGRYLVIGEMEMMEAIEDNSNHQPSFNNNLYILLAKEEVVNLTAFLLGTDEQQDLIWTSETPTIATVNNDGLVTALVAGTSVISVRTEDGNFIASCKIKVIDEELPPPIDGELRLMVLLHIGETFRLEFEGDEQVRVIWSSENSTIANVDTWLNQNRRGEVTAISEGTTFINADDGTQSEIIYVKVEP